MAFVSIVIPTYEEVYNIPVLTKRLDAVFKKSSHTYEIILVDDNSNDGTREKVDELKEKYTITMHERKNERGLSSAVLKGFELARGEIFICMDADMSHPPEKVIDICNAITNEGADFVVGSRNIPGGSSDSLNLYRKLNAYISRLLARPLVRITDPMAGFFGFRSKLFTQELIERLNPIGWKICLEILVKMSPQIYKEIPIVFAERLYGESKLSFKEQLRYLMHLKRLYYYKYNTIAYFIVFGTVGVTGIVVDLSVMFTLSSIFNVDFRISRIFGIAIAMTTNFLLNRFITFKERAMRNFVAEYFGFVLICSVGAFLNWFVSVYCLNHYAIHYLVASFIGILAGTVVNFIGSNVLVFRK